MLRNNMKVLSRQHDNYFRAATALNNSAVTLLKRGHIRAPMSILRDGIYFMKLLVATAGKENRHAELEHEHEQQLYREVETAMRFASQITSLPPHDHTTIPAGWKVSDFGILTVKEVSSQDDPFSVLLAIEDTKDCEENPFVLYCIAIDSIEIPDYLDYTADINSACLFYNYAVIKCLIASKRGLQENFEFYEESLHLFGMCERIIFPQLSDTLEENQSTSILLLRLLVFQATIEVARQLSRPPLENRYRKGFASIATIIKCIHATMPSVQISAALA